MRHHPFGGIDQLTYLLFIVAMRRQIELVGLLCQLRQARQCFNVVDADSHLHA
jgi:hypothetical protein